MAPEGTHPPPLLQNALLLARDSILARLDRDRDCQPFFRIDLGPPTCAVHDSWDYCDIAARYLEALLLIRRVTGIAAPEEERALRRSLLSRQHPVDGLFYNPRSDVSEYLADMFCQSRVLLALCTLVRETGDGEAAQALRRLARGLTAVAEWRDGYAYYPRNLYREGEWLEGGLFYEPKDLWTVKPGYGGTQLEGLMEYAELTGDELVLPFVGGYLRYFLEAARVVDEEGRYRGHLHSQGIVPTMVGAARYAQVTGDTELLARCERFLRWTLTHCSRFGWVPDGIGWPTCETCALGDVIHLALLLSRLGQGDFRYEVERFARNQLLENQFRDGSRALAGREPEPGVERMVTGSFASWARPNDLLAGPDLEGCCTGGGVRALCRVLDEAVTRDPDGTNAVHLLFTASSGPASIQSFLPFQGRVVVTPGQAGPLRLRCPEGVALADLSLWVDGRPVALQPEGHYLRVEGLPAGAEVAMTFPLALESRIEVVAGVTYRVTWRGSSVVDLSPRGPGYPTYLREDWLPADPPTAA